jgi:hypothetical protein
MKYLIKISTPYKTYFLEYFTKITFKDYRGECTVKLDEPRHLVQDLDKFANYKTKK